MKGNPVKRDKPLLLIIEDDPGLQKLLRWNFEAYEVLVAGDRESALALIPTFFERSLSGKLNISLLRFILSPNLFINSVLKYNYPIIPLSGQR